jgi:HlyD family secretion protein
MIAGMPAEVMILNRERTFFDYLMQPLKESLDKSFREN